jgi:hypothetical protein
MIMGLITMIFGLSPMVYFYFKRDFYKFAIKNIFITTEGGVNNLAILDNLAIRFGHLHSVIMPSHLRWDIYAYIPVIFFWCSVIWLLYLTSVKKKTELSKRRICFVLFLFFFILIMSAFTFTELREGHLFILFPLIQIIMGAAVFEAINCCKSRSIIMRIISSALFILLLISGVIKCLESHSRLKEKAENYVSCDVRDLTKWLFINNISAPMVFHYNTGMQISFYSDLSINPVSLSIEAKYMDTENGMPLYFEKLKNIMSDISRSGIYIFTFDDSLEEYGIFKALAKKLNRKIDVKKTFLSRRGEIRFLICSLE